MIKHFISTSSGHSGSPILFMSDENGPSVIGVHKGSNINRIHQSNLGIRISQEMINYEDRQREWGHKALWLLIKYFYDYLR